jgi:hypothetical protein
VCDFPGGPVLGLLARADSAQVLVKGDQAIRLELAHAKALVAAIVDASAGVEGAMVSGGVYHASGAQTGVEWGYASGDPFASTCDGG